MKEYPQNTSYSEILRDGESEGTHNIANLKLPYGIAKGLGLSTKGMTPHEVWEMLKGHGVNPKEEYEKQQEKFEKSAEKKDKKTEEAPHPDEQSNPEAAQEVPEKASEELSNQADNPFNDDAYSQERKNNAMWCQSIEQAKSAYLQKASEVIKGATEQERHGIIGYTSGSGGFNRPLRGYATEVYGVNGYWGKENYKGIGKVDLNNEGKAEDIKYLTDLVDKSTYDQDIWAQRGVNFDGAKQFLGIKGNINAQKLQQIMDGSKSFRDEGFMSCGAAKGTGFTYTDVIFNVYCPKGTKMLYAGPISAYGGNTGYQGGTNANVGHENEMLLQRGSEFQMTKYEKGADGKWYIDIEVTNQSPLDLEKYYIDVPKF